MLKLVIREWLSYLRVCRWIWIPLYLKTDLRDIKIVSVGAPATYCVELWPVVSGMTQTQWQWQPWALTKQTSYWEAKIHALPDHTFNWLVRQTCGLEKPNSSGERVVGSFFSSCCSLTFKTTADFASLTSRHRWTSALRSPRHGANVRSCLCCGIRSWHETQI